MRFLERSEFLSPKQEGESDLFALEVISCGMTMISPVWWVWFQTSSFDFSPLDPYVFFLFTYTWWMSASAFLIYGKPWAPKLMYTRNSKRLTICFWHSSMKEKKQWQYLGPDRACHEDRAGFQGCHREYLYLIVPGFHAPYFWVAIIFPRDPSDAWAEQTVACPSKVRAANMQLGQTWHGWA